jgi:hypothetical protein
MNDFAYAITFTLVVAFAIFILLFIVSILLLLIFKIDLYNKYYEKNKISNIIGLFILSFMIVLISAHYLGMEHYGSMFQKDNFNAQFIVQITNHNNDTYYEKGDGYVKGSDITLTKIFFNNGGYLTVDQMSGCQGYNEKFWFHDQDYNNWDCQIISQKETSK